MQIHKKLTILKYHEYKPVRNDEFLLSFLMPLEIRDRINIALSADDMSAMCKVAVNVRREAFLTLTAGPSILFRITRAQSAGERFHGPPFCRRRGKSGSVVASPHSLLRRGMIPTTMIIFFVVAATQMPSFDPTWSGDMLCAWSGTNRLTDG